MSSFNLCHENLHGCDYRQPLVICSEVSPFLKTDKILSNNLRNHLQFASKLYGGISSEVLSVNDLPCPTDQGTMKTKHHLEEHGVHQQHRGRDVP